MSQFQKAMLVLLVVMVGIWGCAQGRSGSSSADKIKALESKVNRLEEDFRAAATARDQFRSKVTEAELTLSFDHRILDGGAAGRLLHQIAELLQKPEKL